MNKSIHLSTYEQRQADRLVAMHKELVSGGLTYEGAIRKIIRDLKRNGSEIKPSFVKLVLNQ